MCRILQSCSKIWWMMCFWWQLTYDITIHIIRLFLKRGCFEINVGHQATHPKSWSCGSKGSGLQVILLFVLESCRQSRISTQGVGANVRTTLELDPVRRHWNKRQASITGMMKGYANLPRATFDVIWVDSGLRVSVSAPWGHNDFHNDCVVHDGHHVELHREKIAELCAPRER